MLYSIVGQSILENSETEEIWRPIPKYEGYYIISNFGNVKSCDRTIVRKDGFNATFKSANVKSQNGPKNYQLVRLTKNAKGETLRLHRLVAMAFIPNPDNKPEVNHIDCNKLNNKVSNLEWATPKENMRHAVLNGKVDHNGDKNSNSKLTKEDVLWIRNNYKSGDINYFTEKFKVKESAIYKILRKESWKYV